MASGAVWGIDIGQCALEGPAMSRPRRPQEGRRRGVRLHRVSQDPQPARLRPRRIDRRGPEAVPLAELGAGRPGGGVGVGAGGPGAVHQAAAGGGQENPRHRPLRSPAANPLRPERRDLGLPADGRRERGGGIRPGDGDRPVRHEARRRLPRLGPLPEARHRGRHRAAYAAGAVQLPAVRPVGRLAAARRIRSREPARVGGDHLAGHRRDRPGDHQRLSGCGSGASRWAAAISWVWEARRKGSPWRPRSACSP